MRAPFAAANLISWVFLAGDRVVKVERPVTYGFVDHTTLARRRSCLDEVRLNRRLTTGVYLGAVPIVRTADGYRVDGHGPAVEWATLMRRLPAAGMLEALLAGGAAPAGYLDLAAGAPLPSRDLEEALPGHSRRRLDLDRPAATARERTRKRAGDRLPANRPAADVDTEAISVR